jgi:hypothetical protein
MMEWWTYFVGNEYGINQVVMVEGNGSFGDPIYLPGGGSSTEPIAAAGFNNDWMDDKGDEYQQLLQLL